MLEQTEEQKTAEYYSDLDSLLERVISGNTSTSVGLTRRLAEVAEEHYKPYTEVSLHFQLRFQLHNKEGAYTPEQIAKIAPGVRGSLGLNEES